MSFLQVLFSPTGRITQSQFWGGWAALVGANIGANFIPLLGFFISLGLIYVGICVYGKRLHDMGKTAWLHVIPWVFGLGFMTVMIAKMMPLIIEISENPDVEPDTEMIMPYIGSIGVLFLASSLMWIGYTIWVGASRSQPGENKHGPEPGMSDSFDIFN